MRGHKAIYILRLNNSHCYHRYEGLRGALAALSGVNVTSIEISPTDNLLAIAMEIKKCRAVLYVTDDEAQTLRKIQVSNGSL